MKFPFPTYAAGRPMMALGILLLAGSATMVVRPRHRPAASASYLAGHRAFLASVAYISRLPKASGGSEETPTLFRGTKKTPRLKVRVDALQGSHLDVSGLRTALESKATSGVDHDVSDWVAWARLDLPPVLTQVTPSSEVDSALLGTLAVRSPEGACLCLANRAAQKIEAVTQIRLSRGAYKIERLTLKPLEPKTESSPVASNVSSSATPSGNPSPLSPGVAEAMVRMERLEGMDLAVTGESTKRYTLQPGEICVYRYTDQAKVAGVALYETYARLHQLAISRPGPARRLRRMLKEGEPSLFGLRGNSSRYRSRRGQGLESRLNSAHQLLLVTAQAQSLARNYSNRGTLPAEAGQGVMAVMDRLSDALAEISATLLGLVPQVTVTTSSPPTSESGSSRSYSQMVLVALANTGGRSVGTVKLGLDLSALPRGVRCEPSDPALFEVLHPGQTARASFHLRVPASVPVPASRCAGDVSYFVARGPVHLRLRPW